MEEWPKFDPVTGRKICESCWAGIHYKKLVSVKNMNYPDGNGGWRTVKQDIYERRDSLNGNEHACNGECDCMHLEDDGGKDTKKALRDARKARRALEQEALEHSPLAVRA